MAVSERISGAGVNSRLRKVDAGIAKVFEGAVGTIVSAMKPTEVYHKPVNNVPNSTGNGTRR